MQRFAAAPAAGTPPACTLRCEVALAYAPTSLPMTTLIAGLAASLWSPALSRTEPAGALADSHGLPTGSVSTDVPLLGELAGDPDSCAKPARWWPAETLLHRFCARLHGPIRYLQAPQLPLELASPCLLPCVPPSLVGQVSRSRSANGDWLIVAGAGQCRCFIVSSAASPRGDPSRELPVASSPPTSRTQSRRAGRRSDRALLRTKR